MITATVQATTAAIVIIRVQTVQRTQAVVPMEATQATTAVLPIAQAALIQIQATQVLRRMRHQQIAVAYNRRRITASQAATCLRIISTVHNRINRHNSKRTAARSRMIAACKDRQMAKT